MTAKATKSDGSLQVWHKGIRERATLLTTLAHSALGPRVMKLANLMADAMAANRKVLLFGNGGSAASAQHAAAELVGRYERERKAMPAIALTTDASILTAVSNDYGYERVFERQVTALAREGDVVIALSTSGRSKNILRGLQAARRSGAITAALLGQGGGPARRLADLPIVVPASRVPLIQEAHDIILHLLCESIDRRLPAS